MAHLLSSQGIFFTRDLNLLERSTSDYGWRSIRNMCPRNRWKVIQRSGIPMVDTCRSAEENSATPTLANMYTPKDRSTNTDARIREG